MIEVTSITSKTDSRYPTRFLWSPIHGTKVASVIRQCTRVRKTICCPDRCSVACFSHIKNACAIPEMARHMNRMATTIHILWIRFSIRQTSLVQWPFWIIMRMKAEMQNCRVLGAALKSQMVRQSARFIQIEARAGRFIFTLDCGSCYVAQYCESSRIWIIRICLRQILHLLQKCHIPAWPGDEHSGVAAWIHVVERTIFMMCSVAIKSLGC
mmetsp:Transcript_26632/g.48736  ORF Transcript_26632/g.48736 Transcript_26632/m.48736 type:complete len:212 (+) Transcript_26632:220-855(+)